MILNVVIIAQRTLKKELHIIIITQLLSILCFRIRVSYPTHTYTLHSITHTLYSFARMMLALWIGQRNRFSIDKKHIEIPFTNVRPIIWWFRLNSFIKTYSSILYFAPFICLHQHIIFVVVWKCQPLFLEWQNCFSISKEKETNRKRHWLWWSWMERNGFYTEKLDERPKITMTMLECVHCFKIDELLNLIRLYQLAIIVMNISLFYWHVHFTPYWRINNGVEIWYSLHPYR